MLSVQINVLPEHLHCIIQRIRRFLVSRYEEICLRLNFQLTSKFANEEFAYAVICKLRLYAQNPIDVVSWHHSTCPRIMFRQIDYRPPTPSQILDCVGVTPIHYVSTHDCFRVTSSFSQKSLVSASSNVYNVFS